MSAFAFDLATLPEGSSRVEVDCAPAELELPAETWRDRIRGEFAVDKNGDQVTVRGVVRGEAALECVRCLRAFELRIEVPILVYAQRSRGGRHAVEERDLDRDDYMKFHDGRRLILADEARESLILELPIAPRCRKDCRGLCPRCGADRNEGPCACDAPG
jgi:uncharacterized protein